MKRLDTTIPAWDGETVHLFDDPLTGAKVAIAIHRRIGGRAAGGTRMKSYESIEHVVADAQRLAEGMTFKWAVAGLEFGGGKAVISVPEDLGVEARRNLLQRYGDVVRSLEGAFLTGPDLGTSSEDMDIVAEHAPGLALGRTEDEGGAGDPAPFTALGVLEGMRVTLARLDGEPVLQGAEVLIQGVGNVGAQLVTLLLREGARVKVSDTNPQVVEACAAMGLETVDAEDVYETACDIFAPCGVGGILRRRNIRVLRCRAVVGAANTQLRAAEDADCLKRHDILYAPDFVVNCGGAIAITRMELDGWSAERAREETATVVREYLATAYADAERDGCSTHEAARKRLLARIPAR